LRARAVGLFDAGREASEALQRVDGEIRLCGVRGAIGFADAQLFTGGSCSPREGRLLRLVGDSA